jgi:hypothetical protein
VLDGFRRAANSTGPVEAALNEVAKRIHARVGSFTNRRRMAKLLALMTLDMRESANGRLWADRIRERICLVGGHACRVRPHDDPKDTYSLLT